MSVRPWALWVAFPALLLVGFALGSAYSHHQQNLARAAEARALADGVLASFITGGSGFEELRDHFERQRGESSLVGIRLLTPEGARRNRYPRDHEGAQEMVVVPIQGTDGVLRAQLAMDHRPMRPWEGPHGDGPWVGLVAALVLGLGGGLWHQAQGRRQVEAENQALKHQMRLAEAEDKNRRLTSLWDGVQAIIHTDAAQMNNHLQEIDGFVAQLGYNLRDAVHDLYKAPILSTGELRLASDDAPVHDVKSFLRRLEDRSVQVTQSQMTEFVRRVDETMDAIKWVIDGLPDYANRNLVPLDPHTQMQEFLAHLPPALKQDWLHLEYQAPEGPLPAIRANRGLFRSTVKNVLYNATAALNKQRRKLRREQPNWQGWVRLDFVPHERAGFCGLRIRDSGPGIPPELLGVLYQNPNKAIDRPEGGVGSIIVATYLSFMEGDVSVRNLPEGGAEVVLWYALAPEGASVGEA